MGSNPTTWLVAVAFFLLAIAIEALTNGKDDLMKTTNSFFANVRTVYKRLKTSLITTTQAIATAVVTDLVTTFLYAKGAPSNGRAPFIFFGHCQRLGGPKPARSLMQICGRASHMLCRNQWR